MSLADELLADLEEAGDEGEDGLYPEEEEGDSDGERSQGRMEGALEDIPEEMEVDYSKAESVASIAKLRNSKQVFILALYKVIFGVNKPSWVYNHVSFKSFQTLWRKSQNILESSAKTQTVSDIFKTQMTVKILHCVILLIVVLGSKILSFCGSS